MSYKTIIETWKGIPLEQLLKTLYVDKNMTIPQIAKELCVSVGTIHGWLVEYQISKTK